MISRHRTTVVACISGCRTTGGGRQPTAPRYLKAVDEGEDVRQIDAVGVGDPGAVPVGDVRVHREHGVGAAENVGTARVTEAHAALGSYDICPFVTGKRDLC